MDFQIKVATAGSFSEDSSIQRRRGFYICKCSSEWLLKHIYWTSATLQLSSSAWQDKQSAGLGQSAGKRSQWFQRRKEHEQVGIVLNNFPGFMWILKWFNIVNEITYHHAVILMHLSCAQLLNCKAETPIVVSQHCPLNTPKNNLLTPLFWSFEVGGRRSLLTNFCHCEHKEWEKATHEHSGMPDLQHWIKPLCKQKIKAVIWKS